MTIMRYVFFVGFSILLLTACASMQAQPTGYVTSKELPDKLRDAFKEAYAAYTKQDYAEAIKGLEKLIKKMPNFVNAYHVLADVYIQQRELDKAKAELEKSLEFAPDYEPFVYYKLGQIAMEQRNYVEAATRLEKFLTYPPKTESSTQKAKKMLGDAKFRPWALTNPVDFKLTNMGPNINSSQRDYFPSITADENTLVYTVQIGSGQHGQEDLYRSVRREGVWQKSEPLPNVNTHENEGAQSVSADGKFLVFTVCNRPNDYGSCDLYFSELINGRWSQPKNIGAPINTANWESQPSVAANGEAIYFTRGGARGQGDKNLWVSLRKTDGTWAEPTELKELNTPFDEQSPCIHPDGQTLYFSSEGHPGMGSFDLYITRRNADGTWGKPENLGYPINTENAEEALSVSLSGNLAFIASDREGGFGSLDIYSFNLPASARPKPVTYVRALVLDATTRKPLPSTTVELSDVATGKLWLQVQTDKDGEFLVCLPMDKDYALNVQKAKYLFYSDNFALSEVHGFRNPLQLEIPLQPILNGGEVSNENKDSKPIVLKNVFFAPNSAELKPVSKVELDKLKTLLLENPKMRIQLNGHTDNIGEDEVNMDLSQRRANAVRNYLIEQGIDKDRMTAKGFGESMPIATNDTPEGRALNRRTEFISLK